MKTSFVIPASHPVFSGHFPEHPVVPGVLLLQQIEQAIIVQYPAVRVMGIKRMKFLRMVMPDMPVDMEVVGKPISDDGSSIDLTVRLYIAGEIAAKGILTVGKAAV